MAPSDDQRPPLEAFLEHYWKDREHGSVRELNAYLALFPGDDKGIAREYLRCEEAPGATGQMAAGSCQATPSLTS